jgi:hypothetical protein
MEVVSTRAIGRFEAPATSQQDVVVVHRVLIALVGSSERLGSDYGAIIGVDDAVSVEENVLRISELHPIRPVEEHSILTSPIF